MKVAAEGRDVVKRLQQSASVCFLFSANDKLFPGKLKMFYDCRHGRDSIIRVTAK